MALSKKLTITIVVPVYNEEKYIDSCLKSIINQSRKPDQILIVDNNCTDKTIEIAEKYPVKVIKEEKQGMIFARNTGFNSASTEIIARTDADSILPSDWIDNIYDNFQYSNTLAITGPIFFYDFFSKSQLFSNLYQTILRLLLKKSYVLLGPNMILRKSLWNKIKHSTCINDKKVHEDIDLSIHIIKSGQKINFDSKLIVGISARRIKYNPLSFFIEYFIRTITTFTQHKV